jgi:HSP20 family molecular chaperone IbpA
MDVLKVRREREETRKMLIPSSRARLIARVLRMRDDYDIQSTDISADNGKLTIQIAFGNAIGQST